MIRFHDHSLGEVAPDHRIGPCTWRYFDLLAVHRGRMALSLSGDNEIELNSKQAILIYPHTSFTAHSAGSMARASAQHFEILTQLHGRKHAPRRSLDRNSQLPAPFHHLAGKTKGYRIFSRSVTDQLDADIQRAILLAHQPHTTLNHAARISLLTLIICQLLQEDAGTLGGGADPHGALDFSPVIDLINSQPGRQISLADMAAHMNMSVSHFRALFAAEMDVSPGRYLAQVRYAYATRLLRETRLPIKEIARRVGYDEVSHFYRFFSVHSDLTPMAYRNRNQLRG